MADVGQLVPENYSTDFLPNREERMVVEAFRDRLSDGWRIIPDVSLTGYRDWQIDIVVVHPEHGVAVIEVKGHRVQLVDGVWLSNGSRMNPQPFDQARTNAYELRSRLRSISPALARLDVEYAVAFPNTATVGANLPHDIDRSQLILGPDLEDPMEAVERLMHRRWGNQRIGVDGVRMIVQSLRPTVEMKWDPEAQARLARMRLEVICQNQVHALESLDANRKVVVTGGAGSGKTRLAMAWARRALARGDRTLLTCFNVPLAGETAAALPESERLTVGAFYDIAMALDGMPEVEVPDDADVEFWESRMVGHLQRHWKDVTNRFDTIIIDEAQDFNPTWITQLQQLLDSAGPRRLLIVADQEQMLFRRGFTIPTVDDGWTRCELDNNCRNTFQIASILRRHLGGSAAPVGGPDSECVTWLEADEAERAIDIVGEEIDRIVDEEGHEPPNVVVVTPSRDLRDRLREQLALVPWEERGPEVIICETAHRVKGLEFDYVIFVATGEVSDAVLYVAVSRAVVGLSIVGPRALADRLGLT